MGSALTDKQEAFIQAIIRNGGNKKAAAEEAGYSAAHVAGARLCQSEHIQDAIRARRESVITTKLAGMALGTMEELLSDKATSPAVRFQTARWVLEVAGQDGSQSRKLGFDPDKPLNEMNLDELQAFIVAGSQAIEHLKAPRLVSGQRLPVDEPQAIDREAEALM